MLDRLTVAVASTLVCMVLLVACGQVVGPATEPSGGGTIDPTPTLLPTSSTDLSDLAATEWVLESLNDTPIDPDQTITLSFDERVGRGNTGCNDYGGDFSVGSSGAFSMPVIEQTSVYCPDAEGELENLYLIALSHVDIYNMSGDHLTLSYESGTKVLVFRSAYASDMTASPTTADVVGDIVTPSPVASSPPTEIAPPAPTVPHVDLSPLDDPGIDATVYWLGQRFEPDGDLSPLKLSFVAGPALTGGGPDDSQGELQYDAADATTPTTGVILRLWSRSDWDAWVARDPANDPYAAIFHLFWNSPCAQREELTLENGQAVIYSSHQAPADPVTGECPGGQFDRFLAHVFLGNTVVTVNAPFLLEAPTPSPYPAPYNSLEGLRAVVNGLQPREPVADPTPLPAPAASLDDPRSLVLQPADLPGRYGYGDDGCSPAYECNIGPGYFSSEGGYDDLQMAAGEFLSTYIQYEHVGFESGGTPDTNIEPPRIDSLALVCVAACDPAAILEAGPDLLRYHEHSEATEIDVIPDIGDAAHLYQTNTLVLGQVSTGYAVVWRDGPVVGFVAVGGVSEERGAELAMELAVRQEERIQQAHSQRTGPAMRYHDLALTSLSGRSST